MNQFIELTYDSDANNKITLNVASIESVQKGTSSSVVYLTKGTHITVKEDYDYIKSIVLKEQ